MLTKYGTGGNYNIPLGKVTVRIDPETTGNTIGIVIHEIVHMTIQHLIERYQVRHWRKERMVDLLVEQYFPGLMGIQSTQENVSVVDTAYATLFPDIESVAQSVGDLTGG